MADPVPVSPPVSVPQPTPRMSISSSTGAATGGGTASIIAFFWNWWMVKEFDAPQMGISDAIALSVLLAPVFSWFLGWLPMPPARNRRSA